MIHPSLTGRLDLRLEDLSPAEVAARAECVFSCLPHGASAAVVPALLDAGRRVVDFSADYRLNDAEVYAQWYGQKHADPGRLGKVVYGLPELFREQIPPAPLVANPGCYPTSAILALAPLLKAGLIEPRTSSSTPRAACPAPAARPSSTTHYPECNESISAYNVGRHRHTPEIEQVLGTAAGTPVEVIFTPHLVPMDRGILTTDLRPADRPSRARRKCCRRSATSTPTSRSSAWSSICRARRTRPARISATSRPAWSAAGC